jgi:hypothetical protein
MVISVTLTGIALEVKDGRHTGFSARDRPQAAQLSETHPISNDIGTHLPHRIHRVASLREREFANR